MRGDSTPLSVSPEIVYENSDFLAVNKPAGFLVHASKISNKKFQIAKKKEEKTLVDWLLVKYPEIVGVGDEPNLRPGIVHRLDKATSGVMVVAKTQEYFDYLKNLFQNKKIKKTYLAIVCGKLKNKKGVIDKPISLKPGTIKHTIFKGKMTKEAVTEYEVEKIFKDFSLLKVWPKTGRTHQIRVHLASLGNPVAGDQIYGGAKKYSAESLMLHALSIEFVSKDGKRINLETGLPTRFKDFMRRLEIGDWD